MSTKKIKRREIKRQAQASNVSRRVEWLAAGTVSIWDKLIGHLQLKLHEYPSTALVASRSATKISVAGLTDQQLDMTPWARTDLSLLSRLLSSFMLTLKLWIRFNVRFFPIVQPLSSVFCLALFLTDSVYYPLPSLSSGWNVFFLCHFKCGSRFPPLGVIWHRQ